MSPVERRFRKALAGGPSGTTSTALRILLVGQRAAAHAAGLDAAGARVGAVADAADLERPPGPWDVVVLDGALERERWDRWLLQRIHRALAPDGRLIVSADHVFDLVSPAAWTYLAARAVRQLKRRLSPRGAIRSEEHTSELQSRFGIS